jgi:hypothetical protein
MKTIKLLPVLLLFFSAVAFLSCDSSIEPVDPALNVPPENPGGGTTGDYWPMAVNNSWTFVPEAINPEPQMMKIIATESINSSTYYKYDTFIGLSTEGQAFVGTVWTKKENGTYYVRQEASIPAVPGMPSITISPLEIIILKDFLPVNGTWTQNFTQTTTIEGLPPIQTAVSITGKILEKDVTVTVNDVSYENVIKVEVIQNTQGQTITNYYSFAKNIGLIANYSYAVEQNYAQSFELISYDVN